MTRKRRMGKKPNNNNMNNNNKEISSNDLAIIAAGFAVMGDVFDLLSLLRLREENQTDPVTPGEASETQGLDDILLIRSKK